MRLLRLSAKIGVHQPHVPCTPAQAVATQHRMCGHAGASPASSSCRTRWHRRCASLRRLRRRARWRLRDHLIRSWGRWRAHCCPHTAMTVMSCTFHTGTKSVRVGNTVHLSERVMPAALHKLDQSLVRAAVRQHQQHQRRRRRRMRRQSAGLSGTPAWRPAAAARPQGRGKRA